MSPSEPNFEHQMQQLIQLLKKFMKQFPGQKYFFDKKGDKSNPALNVYFINMMPFGLEDFDDLEDWYEAQLAGEDGEEGLNPELTNDDRDFLKQNGIKF